MTKEQNLEKYFSTPRLQPYFNECKGNVSKSMELYQLNMRLAGAFWPLLSVLEVALRNAIDCQLIKYFKQDDWFEEFEKLLRDESAKKIDALKVKYGEPPKGYKDTESLKNTAGMIKAQKVKIIRDKEDDIRIRCKLDLRKSDSFKKLNEFEKLKKIKDTVDRELIRAQPISINKNIRISGLNFSFWTSLFKKELYKCLKGTLINIFPNKNPDVNQEVLANMLDEIRNFRNRVAHNENVLFVNMKFDLQRVELVQYHIQCILVYLGNDLKEFSNEIYIIHDALLSVESFVKNLPAIIGIEIDKD